MHARATRTGRQKLVQTAGSSVVLESFVAFVPVPCTSFCPATGVDKQSRGYRACQCAHSTRRGRARPGAPAVRRALLAADGRSASIGESLTRAAALDAGLPPPELQYKLQLPGGRVAYLDLAWRRYGGRLVRLGVEFDGRSSHGSDGAFVADRRRRNRIETIGWGLLEITMIHVTREYTQTGALILATLNGRWHDGH
jgi:hypothetical protein